jgi:hypothetical protein
MMKKTTNKEEEMSRLRKKNKNKIKVLPARHSSLATAAAQINKKRAAKL